MRRGVILRLIGKGSADILAGIFLLHTARAATFQIADPAEFSRIIDTNAVLTTNATINTWLEGPTWVPSGGGFLVFCDQNNRKPPPEGTQVGPSSQVLIVALVVRTAFVSMIRLNSAGSAIWNVAARAV